MAVVVTVVAVVVVAADDGSFFGTGGAGVRAGAGAGAGTGVTMPRRTAATIVATMDGSTVSLSETENSTTPSELTWIRS